ncbi:MAG TPA: hypothetical protein VFP98_10255 [Candidatus Polarisedimenticolia bacterium]|nr:hypothetical protein [Candidatus Polarisedimenticolia bacterium]
MGALLLLTVVVSALFLSVGLGRLAITGLLNLAGRLLPSQGRPASLLTSATPSSED